MAQYKQVHAVNLPRRSCKKLSLCEIATEVMKIELRSIDFWRAVISECLGTFFYVFLGCSSMMVCDYSTDQNVVLVSLCFGLAMTTLVQCFGHISGAHFNPVVTLAMSVTYKITPLRALMYVFAQLGGSIAGAALLYGIVPTTCRGDIGITRLQGHLTLAQGFGIELLLTFILVFTTFATLDPNRKELGSKSLAIGLAVSVCHLAGFQFTKSSMNPARSMGPAFVSNHWDAHWVYWVGPTCGSVAAALLYEFIFDPKRKPKPTPRPPSVLEEDESADTMHYPTVNVPPANTYGTQNGGPHRPKSNTSTYSERGGHVYEPINSGLENQAYAYDSHQRRSPLYPKPPIIPELQIEEIRLEDVHVEPTDP